MVEKRFEDGTEQVVESGNEARQGTELHTMRYVLVIGTVGAFVILAAIWVAYYYGA